MICACRQKSDRLSDRPSVYGLHYYTRPHTYINELDVLATWQKGRLASNANLGADGMAAAEREKRVIYYLVN